MPMIQKILVATDFSPFSAHAMAMAAELAQRYQAQVTLFHVYQVPGFALPEGYVVPGPNSVTELLQSVNQTLDAGKREMEAMGVQHVTTRAVIGAPAAEITRVARDGRFDMIVMGTHGRTGLRHALLGSVAEKVVRTAPCPVVTARIPEHRPEPSLPSGGQ